MIGGLTGFQNSSKTDFGERLLNSVASQSIRHLFTESESVEVAVRCYPSSKLLQGSIDSFKMTGHGLVIRRAFRAKEMMFETDAVAIDMTALLGGKLRLRQPTQAIARVVLTEEAINQAFKADLVEQKLQQVDAPELLNLSGGEPVSFRDLAVTLRPQNQVIIRALTDLPNRKDVPLALTAYLGIEKRRRIVFGQPSFLADGIPEALQGLSRNLSLALGTVLNNMVDLDRFNLDGVQLRLNRLETQGQDLIFSGYAQIEHFPKGG
jgi:hypothetical protein